MVNVGTRLDQRQLGSEVPGRARGSAEVSGAVRPYENGDEGHSGRILIQKTRQVEGPAPEDGTGDAKPRRPSAS